MEQAYAQALWNIIAKGSDAKGAVRALREALVRGGREHLLSRIGKAFQRIAERESRKNTMVLSVARESDEKIFSKEAKRALEAMGLLEADLKTRVDDALIGGWRLEGREVLVDHSYKSKLLSMYNRATSA